MLSKLQPVKFFNHLVEKAYINMMPPRSTLIVPIMLQLCGLVGLLGYLAFDNGQKEVTKLTIQLASEICDRIEQHLDQYLTTPQQINQVTADVMQLRLGNISDSETTREYFWQQMRNFPIGYHHFGNTHGEFIGIERLDNGSFLIKEVSRKTGIGTLFVYTTDAQGNRDYLQAIKNYDPRQESWYINAVNLGKPVRNQIYRRENKPQLLSVSSSYPIYDRTHKLVGVIDINFILSKISQFLANLNVGRRGRTFILERSGLIVASSTAGEQTRNLEIGESQDTLINLATESLRQNFGSLKFSAKKQQMSFVANKTRYFVKVKNWQDQLGLDWLIVVVMSEADFIKPVNFDSPTNIFLSLAIFLLLAQFGILTVHWLLKLIMKLNQEGTRQQVKARQEKEWSVHSDLLDKVLFASQSQPIKFSEGMPFVRSIDGKQLVVKYRLPTLKGLPGQNLRVKQLEIRQTNKIMPIEALPMPMPISEELGNVAAAIANFSDVTQPQQADKLLTQYNRLLELQVKKRTQELLKVIQQLQTTQKQLIQSQKIAARGRLAAERANRAKSQFLANMSHELRTPLNAILGFTQVMSHDKSLSSENQENLAIINRAGEHLLNLINDILEMSKIEAGKTTLNINSFDLIRLLTSLEQMFYLRAASKDLQLIFEYAPDLPRYVQTDESKLRQVLLNLLGNAIKFTHKGRVTLRVSGGGEEMREIREENLPHSPHLSRIFFEIEDTGPGIAPQELDLLFEAFGQTETGKKSQQGTGLGLTISRKYVQMMGGDITVSSNPGEGSKFSFDIEISLVTASAIKIQQSQQQVIGLAPDQQEYRILVVDDVRESRLLLVKMLSYIGFTVKEATNGQEAIASWQEWQPHLILMDMRMPVMDGYEATRVIKKQLGCKEELLPSPPRRRLSNSSMHQASQQLTMPICSNQENSHAPVIIALTASAFEEERQKILSIGCDDFIRKPFTQEVLLEKVSQHLGVKYISLVETVNTTASQEIVFPSEAELIWHLSQMPTQWLKNIRHAAASCSDDMILELLAQIPPEKSQLIRLFRDLANNYQFEKIMELTRTNAE